MIENIIFELSAIVDYRGSNLRYVNSFVSFFNCVGVYNTILVSLLSEEETEIITDRLRLRNVFFFDSRIYNIQLDYSRNLDDEAEIDEQIRKLFVRTAMCSGFNLGNSLIVAGDYHVYKATKTCNLPCIVIRADIEDKADLFLEALYSHSNYDYIEDIFPLFFNR